MGFPTHYRIFFLLFSIKASLSCLDDQCRELVFPGSYFFYGERLINHVIRTIKALDQDACELQCYLEHNCVSINFQFTGTHNCDLNNATHKEHEDLLKTEGYVYHGTINTCGKDPCQNNGTCQTGFTSKGYRCLCSSGFTGDKSELDEGNPTVSTIATTPATVQTTQKPEAECQNYQSLNDRTRRTSHKTFGRGRCDNSLGPGWFRFQEAAGTKMPTSCVPLFRCGTFAPGWLNGAHPKVTDGKVTRQVCFHWKSNCCRRSVSIQVRNCGSFYVYYLRGTPVCQLRFCGAG